MRRLYLPLVISVLFTANLFSQSDEAAIVQMLQAETEAFTHKSFSDLVKEFWILDEFTLANITLVDGVTLHMTQKELLEDTAVPPPNHATFVRTNQKVRVSGNMAFATHDQTVTLADGGKIVAHEVRVLEKVEGVWKIHISTVQQYKPN